MKPYRQNKSRLTIADILTAIATYCFDSIGAVVVLILKRTYGGTRYELFHAAQSMLFHIFLYFAQLLIGRVLPMLGLGLVTIISYKILNAMQIGFIIYGLYCSLTRKTFQIPFLSDLASRWI